MNDNSADFNVSITASMTEHTRSTNALEKFNERSKEISRAWK